MEITWKLNKKRGYFRPVLDYKIVLSKDEIDLGIPPLKVDTKIPKPLNSWESHCFPEKNERAGLIDESTYEITTPCFKNPSTASRAVLVWKENNDYSDVEKGMEIVRDRMEKEILKAQKSLPIKKNGVVQFSPDFREKGTPVIAAERFLKAVSM